MDVRRCPALPHHPWCSTIGAGGLSFRVRNVAGRFPSAITAVTLSTCQQATVGLFVGCDVHGGRVAQLVSAVFVLKSSAYQYQSAEPIARLTHLACLPAVLGGGLTPPLAWWVGNVVLKQASRLDAFSGYPFRTWLTSRTPGGITGTLEVRPSRSSRTRDSPSQVSYAHGG